MDGYRSVPLMIVTSLAATEWLEAPKNPPGDDEVYLLSVIDQHNNALIDDYVVLGNVPKHLNSLSQNITISVVSAEEDESGNAVIAIHSNGVAIYTVLATLAEGNFDDNAFLLLPHIEPKVCRDKLAVVFLVPALRMSVSSCSFRLLKTDYQVCAKDISHRHGFAQKQLDRRAPWFLFLAWVDSMACC